MEKNPPLALSGGIQGDRNSPARTKARRLPASAVKEAPILSAILKALKIHPKVAWFSRMNVGASKFRDGNGERFMRFGFAGCSDIIGQMSDGRFLAIEVKSPSGRTTEAQEGFLCRVKKAGGVAGVARSVPEAWAIVEERT